MEIAGYLYTYSWYFFIYSFIGWCLEVVFCSVNTGQFVNRGFLNGLYCPIYGFGAVAMVLLLAPFTGNMFTLFVFAVLITSLLELVTGFVLEKLFHTKWWDYSEQPFNIGGYICLKFSLAWGLAGVFLMRLLHPEIAFLVSKIPTTVGWVFLAVMYAVILTDILATVLTMKNLNQRLHEISTLAGKLHGASDAVAKKLGSTAISAANKVKELTATPPDLAEKVEEQLAETAPPTATTEKQRLQRLLQKGGRVERRLVRAFPDMEHNKYPAALQALKNKWLHKNKD